MKKYRGVAHQVTAFAITISFILLGAYLLRDVFRRDTSPPTEVVDFNYRYPACAEFDCIDDSLDWRIQSLRLRDGECSGRRLTMFFQGQNDPRVLIISGFRLTRQYEVGEMSWSPWIEAHIPTNEDAGVVWFELTYECDGIFIPVVSEEFPIQRGGIVVTE